MYFLHSTSLKSFSKANNCCLIKNTGSTLKKNYIKPRKQDNDDEEDSMRHRNGTRLEKKKKNGDFEECYLFVVVETSYFKFCNSTSLLTSR